MQRFSVFLTVGLVLCVGATALAQAVIRTSNPAERGLGEDDFPRVKRIARNVYTYEALTGPAEDRYTTNTMFVVNDEGVLVRLHAEGLSVEDATSRRTSAPTPRGPEPNRRGPSGSGGSMRS